MKALIIHASPRKKGNSSFLAHTFAEHLTNAEVTHRCLCDLNYRGCIGCMSCRKASDVCVMRDDLSPLLEEIKTADVVMWAVPVYFEQINGAMKCLIDRMFSYFPADHFRRRAAGEDVSVTRLPAGKTSVILLTQGQEADKYPYLIPYCRDVTMEVGFTHAESMLAACLNGAGDAAARQDYQEEIAALAKKVSARYSGA